MGGIRVKLRNDYSGPNWARYSGLNWARHSGANWASL